MLRGRNTAPAGARRTTLRIQFLHNATKLQPKAARHSQTMESNTTTPLIHWDPSRLPDFGSELVQLNHRLHEHPLFSEAALTHLLDNVSREDYYVNTMDVTSHNLRSRREGEIRGLSGQQVLEAVRNGQIWILLLRPHKTQPAYRELLQEIYAELRRMLPHFDTKFEMMSILISSPNIQVYYHCDIPGQSLWQVRGHKYVHVYPNKPPFLNQAALERIALGEAHEISLPYDEAFEQDATVFDLQPGQMLHWPLNSPHRIVNGNCVNVSFTTEHFTPSIRRTFYVNCANGILRQRFGRTRLGQDTSGLSYWAKFGLVAAYKLTGRRKKRRKVLQVDFAVDPTAPRGVRDIAAYEFAR
jgi:hypothetical protein